MNKSNPYFDFYKTAVDTVWGKKLVKAFLEEQSKVQEALKVTLKVPTFAFSLNKKHLGSWNRATKTLTISYYLVDKHEWKSVLQVLRHEMAHMICSEIWGDIDDNGHHHGELFAKACNIMGISADRCFDPHTDGIAEKEKLVSKVQKLFALGESNFEEEAKLAIGKAYEIMAKHNISALELPEADRRFVFRPVGEIYRKVPFYVKCLGGLMNRHYFVKCIFTHVYCDGVHYKVLELYGEPHNVDVAEYVYHFLLAEGEREWAKFKVNASRGYSKHAFLEGFYDGFGNTLRHQREEALTSTVEGNTLPISIDDPLLEERYRQQYPSVRKSGSRSGVSKRGRSAGRERGKGVTVRQGVSRSGSGSLQLT